MISTARRTLRWWRAWSRAMGARPGDGDAHLARGGIRFEVGERLGAADVDVRAGAKLRVRGRIDTRPVEAGGDPLIRVTHWAQVEVVG